MRVLRSPLLHFLAGGAAVFALARTASPPAYGARVEPVVIADADVARLRVDYTRESGLEPTADDEAALVEKAVEEELLLREALARGLHENDRSVRNWLIEQMRVLSDEAGEPSTDIDCRTAPPPGAAGAAPAATRAAATRAEACRDDVLADDALYARALELGLDRSDVVVRRLLVQKMRLLAARLDEQPPSDQALRAFYAAHADDYRQPERITFWHVFVANRDRGEPAATIATALLERWQRDPALPSQAVRDGDAFPVPPRVVGQSAAQVAKVFGPAFATALGEVPIGAWHGPLASAYGFHLVWIEGRAPGAPPPLDAVRGQLLERWLAEERELRVARLLDELRRRYPLQVASDAWRQRRAP